MKEYHPIVFTDIQIPQPTGEDYISEMLPIIKTSTNVTSQHRLSKALSVSKSPSEQMFIPKNAKSVVFPNILQRTKEDIKKLRQHQLSIIYDELALIKPIMEYNNSQTTKHEKSKSPQKFHSQQNSSVNIKPIRTDLSSLVQDTNFESFSNDSLLKFRKLSPSLLNEEKWQKVSRVNRINKAHEIQKEIHHLERFKTYWKADMINKYLQLKIIQKGLNFKKGLRLIHILINLPHQTIALRSSQTEVKHSPTSTELNAFVYYIPIYEKINNTNELYENFFDWSKYFLDLLHYKQYQATVKYYFLDGREITSLNQIASYEKLVYCNLQGTFDFWNEIGRNLSLPGEFQLDKYVKLTTKLMDLRQKDDILKFFSKRENFLLYFSNQEESEKDIKLKPITQIEQIEYEIDEQLKEEIFDQSIFYMSKQQQMSYLKTIQSFISQNKTKYSSILSKEEEGMRQRKQNIKDIRRKSIEIKLKTQKQLLKPEEQDHIERKILFQDTQSIEEIKEDAADQIDHFDNAVYKKQKKKIEFNKDPFASFTTKDNKKFKEIIKLVNIEQIVLDKKVSRQDVLHYLSLFKALMDSDHKDDFTLKELDFPALYISREQLKTSLPYIILYKNKLNTAKLNEIYDRQYNYVEFLEFLDIFTTEYVVSDKELKKLESQHHIQQEQV